MRVQKPEITGLNSAIFVCTSSLKFTLLMPSTTRAIYSSSRSAVIQSDLIRFVSSGAKM